MGALTGEDFEKRLNKGRRFESVSGGGLLKQVQRLFTSPEIYIPYVLNAKLGMSRNHLTPTRLFWGRTIRIPLEDYDALILYMYGGLYGSELKFTKFLIKNLKPTDVFYDIGANRGFYTFLAAELCKETHSFEPLTSLTDVIQKNVRQSDTITVNPVALSDVDGTTDFYITDSTMVNTIDASVAELISKHSHSVSRKVIVPTVKLDTYVKTHTKPTVMKIDVEGAEAQVIDGGSDFFSSNDPLIAMEIWGKENKWELSMSAADKLRSKGYQACRIDNEGEIQKVDGDLSELVPANGGENFVFKK